IFFIFSDLLDPINSKTKPEEILKWKKSRKTKNCYKLLFARVTNSSDEDDTYVFQILNRVWPSGVASDQKTAYAIAVYQSLLSTNHEKLTISKNTIKKDLKRNLVSYYYYYYYILKICSIFRNKVKV